MRYDDALFNQQIDELLTALQITGPVTLVGVAWGALQSMLYAESKPAHVDGLVLICPDGVNAPAGGFVALVRMPLIGEIAGRTILHTVGRQRWEARLRTYSSDPRVGDDITAAFRAQLAYKGFWRALTSSIASLPINDSSDLFRRIDRRGIRTLVVWGTHDVIIPIHLGQEVRSLCPQRRTWRCRLRRGRREHRVRRAC